MRYINVVIFVLVIILVQFSCEEGEPIAEKPPNQHTSGLTVGVYSCAVTADPFCDNKNVIFQASVLVFPSAEARMFGDSLIAICKTGTNGKCYFSGLVKPVHYVKIEAIGFPDKNAEENTPPGSTSFLDVIFEE